MFQFIPYNDASINSKLPKKFIDEVNNKKKIIENSLGGYQLIITGIRDLYDNQFGKDSKSRNIISLFLYFSPLSKEYRIEVRGHQRNIMRKKYTCINFSYFCIDKDAILYTGDGYIKKDSQLKDIINYIGEYNFKRISCLQVMHHGSSSCWHSGLAKKINPCISVFSADHTRKNGHPHADVLRDFLKFYPILVDKENDLTVYYNYKPYFLYRGRKLHPCCEWH